MNNELQARANHAVREEFLRNLWEEHMRHEFATRDTEETLATLGDDAYVNHISVLSCGDGRCGDCLARETSAAAGQV
jgi:carboxymethylenebutenolidase